VEQILAVNLTGTFLMCQAVLPLFLQQGGGVIVNTALTAGVMAQPYSAAYAASKGGVVLLTKLLAHEYIKRRIKVHAVAPGGVRTPLLGSFTYPDDADAQLFDKIMPPTGEMCEPEEIAAAFDIPGVGRSQVCHRPGAHRRRRHDLLTGRAAPRTHRPSPLRSGAAEVRGG
jgi:NAD(P)-dependent dehydrogenase (short-subunit alcohol dehydrogenase family)